MATFEEFQAALKRRTGTPDTEDLKAQFGGPRETMGQAVKSDVSGLAGLDPTNPSNIGNILYHGVPMALQAGATGMLGPEASPVMKMLASALGSGAGYLFQSGAEPMAKGQAPTTTGSGLLANLGLGGVMEGATQFAGKAGRFLSGKSALKKAEDEALLKHASGVLAGVKESEVERLVKQGLGETSSIPEPVTIEVLTAATAPVQKASQEAMKGVFRGISQKFNATLSQYRELPITNPTIGQAASTIEKDIRDSGLVLGSSFKKIMQQAKDLGVNTGGSIGKERLALMTAGGRTAPLSEKYLSNLTDEQFQSIMGGRNVAGALKAQKTTVDKLMGLRTQFVDTLMSSKDAVDRRAASSMVEAIDHDINAVIPPETQQTLSTLRDEWHQARSTFSNTFRSRLFRASSPDQVAEAIYTGAKTGKQMGHRAALLINQMEKESPDQLPLLRQSFAGMIASRPDAVKEVSAMDPSVFKSLFRGTGFEDPKKFVEAVKGQVNLQHLAQSPELIAKWNSAFQNGMKSLGSKVNQEALLEAEKNIRQTPGGLDMIAKAFKNDPNAEEAKISAGMTAMKKPLGGSYQTYMEHRFLFHTMLSVAAMNYTHGPGQWALPLMYLGSSKAMGAMLSNPKIGRMYYNLLTSPTVEQMGFWGGRLTSAALSESARSSQEEP